MRSILNSKVLVVTLLLSILSFSGVDNTTAQSKKAKTSKKGFARDTIYTSFVEYRTGNTPIIITIPHGGRLTDPTWTVRNRENCPDPKFETVYDTHTPELAELIDSIVFARTGRYPHMVFAKMKRIYVDMNREKQFALPKGDKVVEGSYDKFHNEINNAKESITVQFGAGLLIDLHSHGHKKQEIEIGYQITKDDLNFTDEQLSATEFVNKAGIKNVGINNKSKLPFVEILRGDQSFGSILFANGIACLPHSKNPSSGTLPHFSGGFVTKSHGSANGGTIDAIQLEFNRDSRKEVEARKNTAIQLVNTIEKYLELHYNLKENYKKK